MNHHTQHNLSPPFITTIVERPALWNNLHSRVVGRLVGWFGRQAGCGGRGLAGMLQFCRSTAINVFLSLVEATTWIFIHVIKGVLVR